MNATATVTLSAPAGTSGAVVTLASSNTTIATVPGTITIPGGATTGTFTVTTSSVSSATSVTISAAYGGNTPTASLDVRSCTDWTATAATLGGETVYFDDAIPTGGTPNANWTWDTSQKASGTQSVVLQSTGNLEAYFSNYPNFFHINATEQLVVYALIDPCNPPREIMIQFQKCCDGWGHRAFWGEDLLQWDTLGKNRMSMGPLPTAAGWVRLTMPASQLGLANGDIFGVAFDIAGGGHAWFDRVGKDSCTVSTAPPPASFPPGDTVWFDDAPPTGASLSGTWNWDTTQKASGTKSHNDPRSEGGHQHFFTVTTPLGTPSATDKLVTYVLLDPCDPPNEIVLQFNDGSSWEHRAYWGPNLIAGGTNGTASLFRIGDLPASGQWVRLEVPASSVGLSNTSVFGMAFELYGGHAWFDRSGLAPTSGGAIVPPAPVMTASALPSTSPGMRARMFAWMRRVASKVRGDTPPSVGLAVTMKVTNATGPTRQYSFYTPELQLLSETSLSDAAATPPSYDYIWFGGQPLAQVTTSTGEIGYYFNDHLGAPLLQTSNTATTIWRAERDAYGERFSMRAGGERHQALSLPGQEQDENGPELRYNIFRWYRSGWGRYTQPDPLNYRPEFLFEDSDDRVNTDIFSYARENPLSAVDPLGLVSSSQAQCVMTYTLAGSMGGALVGGGAAGVATGGLLLGPGAGAGAVIGGAGGAAVGVLVCTGIGSCIQQFARTKPWRCTAKCQLLTTPGGLGTGQYIEGGEATGSNQNEACKAAKRLAANSTPPGFRTRHCKCSCQQ